MTVLCFHAVDPVWKSPLALTPEEFERHCAWLARSRTVVPLSEAVRRMDARGRLPRGMVALTFDDGFAQLGDFVFPVLARHGLPATVFLVAATLTRGGHEVDWVDTPPEWPLSTLDLAQIEQAQKDGFEFASHSWAHHTLTDLDGERCREDLAESKTFLEDMLHHRVDHLAYPRGHHDAVVRRSAAAAGYSHSFALPEHHEDVSPHSIPRVGVYPGNSRLVLRAKLEPAYLGFRHHRAYPLVRAALRCPR